MMGMIWVVLLVALTGAPFGQGLPLRSTPEAYPHDTSSESILQAWTSGSGWYAALPALALVLTAVGLLFGCTWCFKHKDCKPGNEGAENQLFTASVTQLTDNRRSQPPDSGFSEPVNNNISEDNNNGPISLREMQNIANNNAAAYIVSENEERNRASRESVVEFEPLPSGIRVQDPLERCADWFAGEDLPRNRLQYLREIGRGWFGRVVEGEIEDNGSTSSVAVKILNQNASLEDKARFLDEAKMYRDVTHENVLAYVAKCLHEDPWILMFELCSMDLQEYLIQNRPKMAMLNETGVPLQLMCDVASALTHLHSRGYLYGNVSSSNVLVRESGAGGAVRAVLGAYSRSTPQHEFSAPETRRHPPVYTPSSEVWTMGTLIWEVCAWGAPVPNHQPPPPDLPCVYRNHLYQVMQLCWDPAAESRPTAAQVHALLNHLHTTHAHSRTHTERADNTDFEERWQRLKPNSIPKLDEHIALVHAPSTSTASHFTGSDHFDNQTTQDTLSVDLDTAVSRSSSIMSDNPLSIQIRSESLNNLHGSLEDVRNIYLTHNETPALECHQGNIGLEEREQDKSDSSVDPWVKDLIAGSQDDVSYYRDVSDVIKNLDNILNSEKTSSSESSHQASPSRDNLSLDCKKDNNFQSSMVKSPGISNFKSFLEMSFDGKQGEESCDDDDADRDTIGTLSHSFERHSDTNSQHTLANLTPETPIRDFDINNVESQSDANDVEVNAKPVEIVTELPKENIVSSNSAKESVVSFSISETNEQLNVKEDCVTPCDNLAEVRTQVETKSINKCNTVQEEIVPTTEVKQKHSIKKVPSDHEIVHVEITPPEEIVPTTEVKQNHSIQKVPSDHEIVHIEITPAEEIVPTKEVKQNHTIPKDSPEPSDLEIVNENLDNVKIHQEQSVLPEISTEVANNFIDKVPSDHEIVHIEITPPEEIVPTKEAEQNHTIPKDSPEPSDDEIGNENLDHVEIHQEQSILPEISTEVANNFIDKVPSDHEIVHIEITPPEEIVPTKEVKQNHAILKDSPEPSDLEIVNENLDNVEIIQEHSILPEISVEVANNFIENEIIKPAVYIVSKKLRSEVQPQNVIIENEDTPPKLDVSGNDQLESSNVESLKNITEAFIEEEKKIFEEKSLESNSTQLPEPVQINHQNEANKDIELQDNIREAEDLAFSSNFTDINLEIANANDTVLPTPEEVQNKPNGTEKADFTSTEEINKQAFICETKFETLYEKLDEANSNHTIEANDVTKLKDEDSPRSDQMTDQSNDSTAYMDLINCTANSKANDSEKPQDNVRDVIQSCMDMSNNVENTSCSINRNESTVYLDLPNVLKETNDFLNAEKTSQFVEKDICASTPKGSECSNTDTSIKESESINETIVPNDIEAATREQKQIADLLSPFESPTKSHQTDTYEENSSVVLGPFENSTTELKTLKPEVEFPKEELLAFSSNFSDINLETPSPLRDMNFLNEVPDIIHFDDITVSEENREQTDSDETDQSGTTKRVSPSTPPNSPGIYLASTSAQKYIVDIDLDSPETVYAPIESDSGLSSLQKEIDLNQIELQITSKLAMAENENNMNIEYSGPLTVEGLVSEDDAILMEIESMPEEVILAGNGGLEDRSEGVSLDEECVQALRNELELKLPLAQVAGIEPTVEPEWGELPPPPELVVCYAGNGGALSPIAEETRHQLSAYEHDTWNPNRTDSSESYPEPNNDSTAEVTDLSTAAVGSNDHSTYTIVSKEHSVNDTYTVQKDVPTSRELTMSADSLNSYPNKNPKIASPIDDKTYNKDDEKTSNCERISQVSPFLMSPTTETSTPSVDNATGVSSLSKTSIPTDAKHSKPSEMSKATSIDSWCSNDTLYNVEENFDDLVLDATSPEFENVKNLAKSASTETLTRNDEKETSHCSTYIINDSKSEPCESFSTDSISKNDNFTYTKAKTEPTGITTTKSDVNESTKSQTKDLAYETLPSYSNCTTELLSSMQDPWKFAQPEMVRRSPGADDVTFTPPRNVEEKELFNDSPQVGNASIKKMDSVDLTCLQDDSGHKSDGQLIDIESSEIDYKSEIGPATSTPITEEVVDDSNVETIPMNLPPEQDNSSELNSLPNFQTFLESAEDKPQDITINQDTAQLLEGSKTLSIYKYSSTVDRTPTYSDFENSAASKAQNSEKSSQNTESGMSSGDFRQFELFVSTRPQDLSSSNANSLFLNNERRVTDVVTATNIDVTNTSRVNTPISPLPDLIATISPNNVANLVESQPPSVNYSMFVTDLDEEETDQPHSIIITERQISASDLMKINELNQTLDNSKKRDSYGSENVNITYDSHRKSNSPETYDSHRKSNSPVTYNSHILTKHLENVSKDSVEANDTEIKVNGIEKVVEITEGKVESPKIETFQEQIVTNNEKLPNGTAIDETKDHNETTCNTATDETKAINETTCNGDAQNYATVNFIHEPFEILDSHSEDDKSPKESTSPNSDTSKEFAIEIETPQNADVAKDNSNENHKSLVNGVENKMAATENFLQNEKMFCALDSYLPLLSDIRFTGPASEIMSTSFTQDSPTEPTSPECEQDSTKRETTDLGKEWDSDSDSHDSNSSSGEFIWKDGDGHETPVVPSTHFDHQQKSNHEPPSAGREADGASGGASDASGASGSEGDEVEFVPSSWDCRAEPSKSSLRTLQRSHSAATDSKKRVVFKRQKYHCVYEYPRELVEVETHSPAYLPDLSTYCEWDPRSAEEAELGYGQLYGAPIDLFPLRAGIAFGADYDEDFYISSSARPFESLGLMSSSSQFFPGMHLKAPPPPSPAPVPAPTPCDVSHPPLSPLAPPITIPPKTPTLDLTTPDSGVEDITPVSTREEDFKTEKIEQELQWKNVDSPSSSESVSPSSPGGESLGGLRHTRDKLKLDLPPSPHIPSPRHNRVFNFVLDKPKRHRVQEAPIETPTPLVMTDETPLTTTNLPLNDLEEVIIPEPTFSTFGKANSKPQEPESPEQKIIFTDDVEQNEKVLLTDTVQQNQKVILTDDVQPNQKVILADDIEQNQKIIVVDNEQDKNEKKDESPKVETVKGEGTVLDSGDEDSGIESSSKATLERKTNNVS